jgi:flagellar protein FliO/FliZ
MAGGSKPITPGLRTNPFRGKARPTARTALTKIDVYELDLKRQLILLRRDNVEHLLLVGGPNDVVVERNIQRISPRDLPARPDTDADAAPTTGPAALPAAATPEAPRTQAPPFPEATAPLVATRDPDRAPAEIAADTRASGRDKPQPTGGRPSKPSGRPRIEPAPLSLEKPSAPASSLPVTATEQGALDPAVLSDMARQLETALSKPVDAPASQIEVPPPSGTDAQAVPSPDSEREGSRNPQDVTPSENPAGKTPGRGAAPPATKDEPPASPQADVPAKPADSLGGNPFSVEDIEAEFARLLGRAPR